MEYYVIWIIVGAAALLIDIITSSFLFVWFTIGAIGAIIAGLLNCSLLIQSMLFIIISAVCMAVGYPIAKRTIKKTVNKTLTMEEEYIGKVLTSEKDIDEKNNLKINGIYWTVKNTGGPIKAGENIKIVGIEGNKILIKKI